MRGEFNRKLNKRMNKTKALSGGKWKKYLPDNAFSAYLITLYCTLPLLLCILPVKDQKAF